MWWFGSALTGLGLVFGISCGGSFDEDLSRLCEAASRVGADPWQLPKERQEKLLEEMDGQPLGTPMAALLDRMAATPREQRYKLVEQEALNRGQPNWHCPALKRLFVDAAEKPAPLFTKATDLDNPQTAEVAKLGFKPHNSNEPPTPEPTTNTTPPVKDESPIIIGALPRALVDQEVRRHFPDIVACQPPRRSMAIKFTVGQDGKVTSAELPDSPADHEGNKANECVRDVFLQMQFAPPESGNAIVSYPLELAVR